MSNLRDLVLYDSTLTNAANVDSDGQLHVVLEGVASANNSSATPLSGDGVFTGTADDTLKYAVIVVSVYSDVASATDGLSIQQSKDGTNWDHVDVFTIPAATAKTFSVQPVEQNLRVVYTNGAGAQSAFRLSTILKKTYVKPSSHRIQDSISTEDDAELTKAVLTGEDEDGVFRNVQTTPDGNLAVSVQSDGLSIAKGDVTDTDYIHKFGEAPDFDTGDGTVTIWDGANDAGINAMTYTYSATANIDQLSSSNVGDTQTVEVQGLDTNWDLVTQTATLNGQTGVTLTTALIRVFRVKNTGTTDFAGDVYVSINGATLSSGVPTTASEVRAIVRGNENQTLMSIFSIPTGSKGYLRDLFASIIGASKTTNYTVTLKVRPFGGVFQTKHKFGLNETGTSHNQHSYVEPEFIAAKSDIELRVSITAGSITEAQIGGGFDIVLIED